MSKAAFLKSQDSNSHLHTFGQNKDVVHLLAAALHGRLGSVIYWRLSELGQTIHFHEEKGKMVSVLSIIDFELLRLEFCDEKN